VGRTSRELGTLAGEHDSPGPLSPLGGAAGHMSPVPWAVKVPPVRKPLPETRRAARRGRANV